MLQLSFFRPVRPTLRAWRPRIAFPLVLVLSTLSAILLATA
ncbi:hypothetical protein [Piscinibacter koreensis]|nr:hypothetical protein [Schlegelella koreensis]